MKDTTLWLSCSALQHEVQSLLDKGELHGELQLIDSMLHMAPLKLDEEVEQTLERLSKKYPKVVLVFGDCSPRMLDADRFGNVKVVSAPNCIRMLAGKDLYRKLMKKGAFVLIPEWVKRWRQVFREELGLDADLAKDFMKEHRTELIYLDSGLQPIPEKALAECAEYTGLAISIEQISLEPLKEILLATENSIAGKV